MIVYLAILLVCLFLDVSHQFFLFGVSVQLHLSFLLLFFIAFRKTLSFLLIFMAFYIVMAHAFTKHTALNLFVPMLFVLIVVQRLRNKFFAESYLVHGFWTFLFAVVFYFLLILGTLPEGSFVKVFGSENLKTVFLNSGILFLLAIPFYVYMDRFDERLSEIFYKPNEI